MPQSSLRQRRLVLEAIAIGVLGMASARIFDWSVVAVQRLLLIGLAGYRPPGGVQGGFFVNEHIGPHGMWLVPLVTTLGGLLAGLLVYTWAPEAEGHGTDVVVQAFHQHAGLIRARVPLIKTIASAITIGSGGSAGREGPTALITGGVASVYATWGKRSQEERRILLLTGMAAGLSAIFRSPVGAAIFGIEVLYSTIEFEASALFYTMLASIIAYALNGLFVGWKPLFDVPRLTAPDFSAYGWYALLGIAGGAVAALVPSAFYRARDAFRALPLPTALKPALGGLILGLVAIPIPQVLGGGYGWIQEAIDGRLATGLSLVLVFAKLLALCLTVSSGGSGGVFAPALFIGAMLGGAFAHMLSQPAAAFVVVGMAAVFAGAARVPIATLLFVTEMTSGFEMLVAAALAVMLSYVTQEFLCGKAKYHTLYEAQVAGRADSPAHQVEQLLSGLRLLESGINLDDRNIVHLDLARLLSAGISIGVETDHIDLVTIPADSPLIGQRVTALVPSELTKEIQLFAILRNGKVETAGPETTLARDDRLLALASPAGQKWMDTGLRGMLIRQIPLEVSSAEAAVPAKNPS